MDRKEQFIEAVKAEWTMMLATSDGIPNEPFEIPLA